MRLQFPSNTAVNIDEYEAKLHYVFTDLVSDTNNIFTKDSSSQIHSSIRVVTRQLGNILISIFGYAVI